MQNAFEEVLKRELTSKKYQISSLGVWRRIEKHRGDIAEVPKFLKWSILGVILGPILEKTGDLEEQEVGLGTKIHFKITISFLRLHFYFESN